MGYCLYGHELDEGITPLEAGLDRILGLDASQDRDFIGREALLALRTRGGYRQLIGLTVKGRGVPRPGHGILADGQGVGSVSRVYLFAELAERHRPGFRGARCCLRTAPDRHQGKPPAS